MKTFWSWSSMTAGTIKDATLATVTAASKLGEVHALVAGNERRRGRRRRRRRSPASARSMSPTRAHLEHQLAEDVAPVAAKLMDSHDAFLAPATTTGKNIAPRVAALLDVMQITDILSVEGDGHLHPPDLRRQRHRDGQVEGRQEGHHRPHAPRSKRPRARAAAATVEQVDAGGDPGTSSFVSARSVRRASGPS